MIESSVAVYLSLKTSEVQILHELGELLTPRSDIHKLCELQFLKNNLFLSLQMTLSSSQKSGQ